jgi:hypothetical protein
MAQSYESKVLIHVGLHKTGSTWLSCWLERHPLIAFAHNSFGGAYNPTDICRSAVKEAPYWYAISDEHLTGGRIWPDGYTSLLLRHAGFHKAPTGIADHRQKVAKQLLAMFPHALILITTRGFASAIRSLYAQVVRIGGDQSFLEFYNSYRHFIYDWLDLDSVISTYRDLFGPDQVVVLPFELLAQDEDLYQRLLEQRLGLPRTPIAIGRVYPSLSSRQLLAYSRFSRLWLQPIARRLSCSKASMLYLAYAAWVVNRHWCDRLIQLSHAPGRHHPAIIVPVDFVEQYRGKASLLATDPIYKPFADVYLNSLTGSC